MRVFACICCVAVLFGCGDAREGPDATAADTTGATPGGGAPGASAGGRISLADLAGTWSVRALAANRDSVLATYELIADADSSWSLKFANRPDTIAVRVVAVDGDSIVLQAGPYPSVLRRNVTVTTRTVSRLQNGVLVGRSVARYTTGGPDTVLVVRTEGTRVR